MPRLTPELRLQRMPALDLSQIKLTPAEAPEFHKIKQACLLRPLAFQVDNAHTFVVRLRKTEQQLLSCGPRISVCGQISELRYSLGSESFRRFTSPSSMKRKRTRPSRIRMAVSRRCGARQRGPHWSTQSFLPCAMQWKSSPYGIPKCFPPPSAGAMNINYFHALGDDLEVTKASRRSWSLDGCSKAS